MIKLIVKILMIIMINNNQFLLINSFKFTDQFCNFTQYPKHGCEDAENTRCIDNKCACIDDSYYIIMDRFCTRKLCSNGEYFDSNKNQCVQQSRASVDVSENHCRYDYHCYGEHVKCRQHGWNFNCVCDPGFRYDIVVQQCLPTHGIGGHCKRDSDCDETTLRKMYCNLNINIDENNNDGKNTRKINSEKSSSISGTCECQDKHRYNYNIDGCEPLSEIAQREHNMRTLILLFVAAGLLFGLALTCNFSFFGFGPKRSDIYLSQLKAEERIRAMKRQIQLQQQQDEEQEHQDV